MMTELRHELRFVVLRHDGYGPTHFDLMFETAPGSRLATWRANEWPLHEDSSLAALPEHRADFLTYEGPLSNNRGSVTRVAAGRHSIMRYTDRVLVTRLENGTILRLPLA